MSAEEFDKWRVVPRLLTLLFGWQVWRVGEWFMLLNDPTAAQSAFVSVVFGTVPAWFGLYVNSGVKKDA